MVGMKRKGSNHDDGLDTIANLDQLRCCAVLDCRGGDTPLNWADTLDEEGWSECGVEDGYSKFVSSLYRSGDRGCSNADHLYCLEGSKCCSVSGYDGNAISCEPKDMWEGPGSFDEAGWQECPDGQFIGGLYRQGSPLGTDGPLSVIERLMCCGPAASPGWFWSGCEEIDVEVCT
jgi:hypothetical protein